MQSSQLPKQFLNIATRDKVCLVRSKLTTEQIADPDPLM
jgi:hypothetical protein